MELDLQPGDVVKVSGQPPSAERARVIRVDQVVVCRATKFGYGPWKPVRLLEPR